jgi:hypothetical protein
MRGEMSEARIYRSGDADRDAGRAEPKEATSTDASVPVGT